MTNVRKLTEFPEEVEALAESKENPEEWYVLIGSMCGEYSVHTDETPEDYAESQEELPPEMQDENEHVDGFMQVGQQGWTADAFEEDCSFVKEYGFGDKIDTRLMNIILVHEDMLTEESIAAGNGEYDNREAEEVPADD